jgi:hypothetical protein
MEKLFEIFVVYYSSANCDNITYKNIDGFSDIDELYSEKYHNLRQS